MVPQGINLNQVLPTSFDKLSCYNIESFKALTTQTKEMK